MIDSMNDPFNLMSPQSMSAPMQTNPNKVDSQMRQLQAAGMGTAQAINKAATNPATRSFKSGGVATVKNMSLEDIAAALPPKVLGSSSTTTQHTDYALPKYRAFTKKDEETMKPYDAEVTASRVSKQGVKPQQPENKQQQAEGVNTKGGQAYMYDNPNESIQEWLDKNFPVQNKQTQNYSDGGEVHQVDFSNHVGPDFSTVDYPNTQPSGGGGGSGGDEGGGAGDFIGSAVSLASMFFEKGGAVPQDENPPPGALKNEVADTIPANLSEGEFVFDAASTRYWGLKTLVGMVEMARAQLSKLDSSGGISSPEKPDGAFKQDAEPNNEAYDEQEFGPEMPEEEKMKKGGITMPSVAPKKIKAVRKSVRGPKKQTGLMYGEGKYLEQSKPLVKKGGLMSKTKKE